MENPCPINETSDAYWRELGWPAVARDKDGHAMSSCAKDDGEVFKDWLLECFEEGWTVTNLTRKP
jgi:hypothetical protein